MKILFFDIETFPLLSHTWSKFVDGPVVAIERDWTIASIAWKWSDKARVHSMSAYPNPHDDFPMVEKLWELFDEADVVIGHNGDKFDIKKVQARMLLSDMMPPSPFQSIDTLKILKRHFALTSNRLNDVCEQLGIGEKVDTGGWQLWADCLANDINAWRKMERYNRQDVALLQQLYDYLAPWTSNHPVLHDSGCPVCGSLAVHRRGTTRTKAGATYQTYQCQDCKSYYRDPVRKDIARHRSATRR